MNKLNENTKKKVINYVKNVNSWLSEEQYQRLLDRICWDIACRADHKYASSAEIKDLEDTPMPPKKPDFHEMVGEIMWIFQKNNLTFTAIKGVLSELELRSAHFSKNHPVNFSDANGVAKEIRVCQERSKTNADSTDESKGEQIHTMPPRLQVDLKIQLDRYGPGYENIKEAVAVAAEIQKEHSCDCTLSIEI